MKRAMLVLVAVAVAFFAGALGLVIIAANDTTSCVSPLRHFCLPPAIIYAALCALAAALVIVVAALVGIMDALRLRNWAAAAMLALLLVIDVVVGIYVVPGHVRTSGPLMHLAPSSWHSLASLTVFVLDVGTLPLALIFYCWLDSAPRRAPQLASLGGLAALMASVVMGVAPPW
jgi:hypothetical protein